MPTRCANCGDFAGRDGRSLPITASWLAYLHDERDLTSPVGRLTMPLCANCFSQFDELRDADEEEFAGALDAIDLSRLVDEGA